MFRYGVICLALVLGAVPALRAQTADKAEPKKIPPAVVEILKSTPDQFLKAHDKNKDGFLSKNEVPPFLAFQFDKVDQNADGKLDREELAQVFQRVQARFGSANPRTAPGGAAVEKVIAKIMQMDTNKDGKISKEEARGKIGDFFERLDANKDGFLDRAEVRKIAENFVRNQKGGNPQRPAAEQAAEPDFDALDRNADGRLTREELQGTPYAGQFDQIDANRDGRLDRREFEAFFRKNRDKQK